MRAVAGTSLGLSLLLDAGCGSDNGSSSTNPWQELAQRISGPVLRRGDRDFARLARPNNLRYAAVQPEGIARCLNARDVSQAILWARKYDMPLVARSGGHSYAGYSTTTGLMIDLKLINSVQFDSASGIIRIGGGALNQNLYQAMQSLGVAITHGRCNGVGAAAFLLGGGIGFNMRAHGMACDALTASEIVLASGDIVSLSPTDNAELFWACQGGGGGNFGINTSFSFQTFPVPQSLTVFNLTWSAKPDIVFPVLLAALSAGPNKLGSRVQLNAVTPAQIAQGQDVSIALLGQLDGSADQLAEILAPVYAVAQPSQAVIREMAYWDAQMNFLETAGTPAYYQERSRYFVGPISDAAVATALQWARQWPGTSEYGRLTLFQTGGQINTLAPDATAFVHRDSDWLMAVVLDWGANDSTETINAALAWQSDFYAAMSPFAGGGAYQNFPDPSLADWAQEYYGSNLPRLQSVKSAVDPTRVFNFPQAIPPAQTVQRRTDRPAARYPAIESRRGAREAFA
jgi:hypothetical protein